ncbi:MAG: tetratricopeptide repeat protein, partial [Octadecabacter sp.]
DDAIAERDKLHGSERAILEDKIAELGRRLANPEEALAQQHAIIIALEEKLARFGNTIGGDRIADAKAALEQGDYSIADDIFAEIEANNDLAVQESARAAYGRGEVAEAEIRWHDAYAHYKRASNLDDTTDHLKAYARMTWRLAKGDEAITVQEGLVNRAKSEFGDRSPEYATQLNNLAEVVRAQGRFPEAETLYREALEIGRATIGTEHPDYATNLNNLAGVVQAQGRFTEAEVLYREALEIDRTTIGMGHPDYAKHLNNLAGAVEAQGRFPEAEALYREALKIDCATIGKGHPDYAIDLNNLAHCLLAQGRPTEAQPLLEQALKIMQATLPADHPYIADVQASLAALPSK